MDRNILKQSTARLAGQRNGFLFFSAILGAAVLLLTCLLFTKRERVIVVPTSGASYWIEEKRSSDAYVEKMGIFLSDLLLNRSPADVEARNRIILQHVHPSSFHEFSRKLQEDAEQVVKGSQAFFFRTKTFAAVPGKPAFSIEGESQVWIEKDGKVNFCTQKSEEKYVLSFRCENGRLLLDSLKKEAV